VIYVRRLLHALGTLVVLSGGLTAGSVALLAGPAGATTCVAPASCSMTGTVGLTGGTLSLTTSGSLGWTGTLTGTGQSLVDTIPADQQYTVDDATGSGAGWHVTVSATTFTNTPTHTFPDNGTFSTNGSMGSVTSSNVPSATCTVVGSCTLPNDSAVTYPVAITTAASSPPPVTIYSAQSASGLGSIVIGNTPDPVGWWVNVPGTAVSGNYTSTIVMTVISAP
jgi:hypothetical protein